MPPWCRESAARAPHRLGSVTRWTRLEGSVMASRRSLTLSVALGAGGLLLAGPAALAAAWEPTVVLRTGAAGVPLDVGDVAGAGNGVVVGWQQTPAGATQSVWLRWSPDRGDTWSAATRLDT